MQQLSNASASQLNGAINNSTTSIVVDDASSFPATGDFTVLIDAELIKVTSVSSNTFTVVRAQENTAAASHLDNAPVTAVLTKEVLTNFVNQNSSREYPYFDTVGNDDEFNDSNFSGWTEVDDGLVTLTVTETNNVASILHPGGDTAAHLHAFLKSGTLSVGEYIECAVRQVGVIQNYPICGLIITDGDTYNAGNQLAGYWSHVENKLFGSNFEDFNNSIGGGASVTLNYNYGGGIVFLRMKRSATNTYELYHSSDGISWALALSFTGTAITPTHYGFFVTTWGGASPVVFTFEYFKKR